MSESISSEKRLTYAVASASVTRSYTTGALADGTYRFRVVVVDEAGNESVCQEVEVAIDSYPAPPEDIAAAYDSETEKITVTWTDPADADLAKLLVYHNSGAGHPDFGSAAAQLDPGVETFEIDSPGDGGDFVMDESPRSYDHGKAVLGCDAREQNFRVHLADLGFHRDNKG